MFYIWKSFCQASCTHRLGFQVMDVWNISVVQSIVEFIAKYGLVGKAQTSEVWPPRVYIHPSSFGCALCFLLPHYDLLFCHTVLVQSQQTMDHNVCMLLAKLNCSSFITKCHSLCVSNKKIIKTDFDIKNEVIAVILPEHMIFNPW